MLLISGCQPANHVAPPHRALTIQQNWELKPGNLVAGHRISGGLGDLSIEMNGDALYAPFAGTLHPHRQHCVIFDSPEVPAYLFRFCDIERPRLGELHQGETMGRGQMLQFATLRKQPSGEWAIVEPAQDILERILNRS
ncbi:MAG: hypothetical protein F6K30_15815, partial [Cyanothece sp. SIO2G6]|nr:hypothetical protein [Cyanothece sp. SIO2G6]